MSAQDTIASRVTHYCQSECAAPTLLLIAREHYDSLCAELGVPHLTHYKTLRVIVTVHPPGLIDVARHTK